MICPRSQGLQNGDSELEACNWECPPLGTGPWSECSRVMPSGTYLNKAIVQKLRVFPTLLFLLSTWMEQPKVPSLESQN